jgi:hypothetical protein
VSSPLPRPLPTPSEGGLFRVVAAVSAFFCVVVLADFCCWAKTTRVLPRVMAVVYGHACEKRLLETHVCCCVVVHTRCWRTVSRVSTPPSLPTALMRRFSHVSSLTSCLDLTGWGPLVDDGSLWTLAPCFRRLHQASCLSRPLLLGFVWRWCRHVGGWVGGWVGVGKTSLRVGQPSVFHLSHATPMRCATFRPRNGIINNNALACFILCSSLRRNVGACPRHPGTSCFAPCVGLSPISTSEAVSPSTARR